MKRYVLLIILFALAIAAIILFIFGRRFVGGGQSQDTFSFPYVQNFDEVNLRPWTINEGVWTIRDGALQQTVGGDNTGQIHLPFNLPEGQPYHLSTFISLKRSTREAGIAFNSQLPELTTQQHRVFLSRDDERNLSLEAGYTDDFGNFVPQARVPLSLDLEEFRLDIFVYEDIYMVQLNGQRVIDKRPLFYNNGMVGFISTGSVIFDTLKITAADKIDPSELVYISDFDQEPGAAGWVPFNGDWRVSDGQLNQLDANAYDTGIGYETSTFVNYVVQVRFAHQQGVGAGLYFNMPSPYQINGAHLVRYSDEADALIWGYYDAQGAFLRQGFADIVPPGDQPHLLQVFSGADSYDVFLDDQLVARDVPLQQSQGAIGLTTSRSTAGFSLVEVFPLFGAEDVGLRQLTPVATDEEEVAAISPSPELPKDGAPTPALAEATPLPANGASLASGAAVPYEGIFTGDFQSSGWQAINGDWRFENGNLVQTDTNGFDFSIVNTNQAFRDYSMQVTLDHLQGYGGGLLFNMPFSDRLNGAHLVRYSDRRPGAIFWGYYNDEGQFVGQGYADVPEAGNDSHTFQVISRETTYDIYLDGNLIASGLPLRQNNGYTGLLTSQSSVAYSQVVIDGPNAETFASDTELQDGFNNVSIVSGRWITEGEQTIQEVTEEGDYILNLGVFASEYSMEANVTLPDNSNAGAGFIFHMPDAGSRNGAEIARIINGGAGVFWGYFDDTSAFQGRGSVAFAEPGTAFILRMEVAGEQMDLWINDVLILEDIPLSRREGWIGLTSFGGPVTFEDIKVQIIE